MDRTQVFVDLLANNKRNKPGDCLRTSGDTQRVYHKQDDKNWSAEHTN